jgi:hypothetical protein
MLIALITFPAGVDRGKKYWIGLYTVIHAFCQYYDKWKDVLPTDLPAEVNTALAAADAACAALKAYDLARKRGSNQKPGSAN